MGNTLKMDKIEMLNGLYEAGWSNRKININIGINRRTISKYRNDWIKGKERSKEKNFPQLNTIHKNCQEQNQIQNAPLDRETKCPPGEVVYFQVPTETAPDPVEQSRSKAAPFDQQIKEKLEKGQHARSIYQDLYLEEEYRGSYDSVKRFIRKLQKQHKKLYARIETLPGEEAQVDFGQGAPTLKNGKYRRPWLFVMTLSHSRKSFEKVVWSQDVETFIRCHEEAFQDFGGVPEIIKIDNLKSAVLIANLYEPVLNPNYKSFGEYYGFVPLPCKVRTPEHKGKVEAGVKYVQNNALQGKRFEDDSLNDQNAYLRKWNRTWATTRIHGTTKRQVGQMFKEEQPHLKSLPETTFVFFKVGRRKVSSGDSHVEVKGAYYPIPPHYMGRRVDVHFNSKWVKILFNGKTIQWLSTIEKGRFHPDKSCLPANKAMDRNAWQSNLLKRCTVLGKNVRDWADLAIDDRGLPAYRSIQGVLNLTKKYSLKLLDRACCLAVQRSVFSYRLIRHYLEELSIQEQIQTCLPLEQESEIIRSPQAYANLFEEIKS